MENFDIISARDMKLAKLVRPDLSTMDLREWERDGVSQVVFVANLEADPECAVLDGNVYDIKTLLTYDNPLFRTSHPNCRCKFVPLPSNENQR